MQRKQGVTALIRSTRKSAIVHGTSLNKFHHSAIYKASWKIYPYFIYRPYFESKNFVYHSRGCYSRLCYGLRATRFNPFRIITRRRSHATRLFAKKSPLFLSRSIISRNCTSAQLCSYSRVTWGNFSSRHFRANHDRRNKRLDLSRHCPIVFIRLANESTNVRDDRHLRRNDKLISAR